MTWQTQVKDVRELVDKFYEEFNGKVDEIGRKHDQQRVNLSIARANYDKLVSTEGKMNIDLRIAVSEAQARRRAYSRDADFIFSTELDNIRMPSSYNENGKRRMVKFEDKDLY